MISRRDAGDGDDDGIADRVDDALLQLWEGDDAELRRLAGDDGDGFDLGELVDGLLSHPDRRFVDFTPIGTEGFHIVRLLGRGGMGLVFEAEQVEPRRTVALKVMRGGCQGDPAANLRFEREVETLAGLTHPGIAAIHASGRTPSGHRYFVMERVTGAPLDRFVLEQRPSLRRSLGVFLQTCDAVDHMHRHRVVHRDLKPSNIHVVEGDRVKVLDFGLAGILEADDPAPDARGRAPIDVVGAGTLAYMSPEQARGDVDSIDRRSDVYALGVILFELLTGRLPYASESADHAQMRRVICDAPTLDPASVAPGLPADLCSIVRRALMEDPEHRYPNVNELSEDVRRYLERRPVSAHKQTAPYLIGRLVARHRGLSAGLAVAALVAVGGMALTVRKSYEEDAARRRAEEFGRQLVEFLADVDPYRPAMTSMGVLARTERWVDEAESMDPAARAELLAAVGNAYRSLSVYDRAEPLLEEALSIRESVFGAESVEYATSLRDLGFFRHATGWIVEAEPLLRRALSLRMVLRGPLHPESAQSRIEHATVLQHLQRFDESEALLEENLRLARAHPDVLDLPQALDERARLFMETKRFESAIAPLNELLEVLPRGEVAARARCHGKLGRAFQGDVTAAEEHYRIAVELMAKSSDRHPVALADILRDRSQLRRSQGRLDDALDDLVRSHDLIERRVGGPHPYLFQARARIARHRGIRDPERTRLFRELIEDEEAFFGGPHPETASAYADLARTLEAREDRAGATEAYREALRMRELFQPPDHPAIQRIRSALARPRVAERSLRRGYSCDQVGGRLSRNAWIPSRASRVDISSSRYRRSRTGSSSSRSRSRRTRAARVAWCMAVADFDRR